jgi:hypothetical protein
MPDADILPTEPVPGNPAAHWASPDPAELAFREQGLGLPRLVCESHARLGPLVTPEEVVADLRVHGIETTADDVRACWPEGGRLSG